MPRAPYGPRKQPGRHTMHGRNRNDGEKRNITPPAVGRADFDFLVRFENTDSELYDARRRACSINSICLRALSCSDRRVLASLLLVRVGCAVPCCAVLAEQRNNLSKEFREGFPGSPTNNSSNKLISSAITG